MRTKYHMISCRMKILVGIIITLLFNGVLSQGKVPPLVATEFTANFIQNKFNHNGFVVNHTCAGTYYSSYSQQMIRADCTVVDLSSNNHSQPSPLTSFVTISLLDFTKSPPLNTVLSLVNLANKSTCAVYEASWLPPFSATFLRDVNAIYAGNEITEEYGVCEKWTFVLVEFPGPIFTFYFDSFTNLVRYDFYVIGDPEQGNVGVTNKFYNIQTGDKTLLPSTIFDGSGKCPQESTKGHPTSSLSMKL